MLTYKAAYTQTEDGEYICEVLDFPGVLSQGKTLISARRMLQDALVQMALAAIELGQPLPRPNKDAESNEADLTEPIYLLLTATNRIKIIADSGVTG